jgi:ribosomal protein S4E
MSKTTVNKPAALLKDGATCKVIAGIHAGKSGTVRNINTSKTGHITITVVPENGERFKTLGKHVVLLQTGHFPCAWLTYMHSEAPEFSRTFFLK